MSVFIEKDYGSYGSEWYSLGIRFGHKILNYIIDITRDIEEGLKIRVPPYNEDLDLYNELRRFRTYPKLLQDLKETFRRRNINLYSLFKEWLEVPLMKRCMVMNSY